MIISNPQSPYLQEMAKWEMRPSEWTLGGLKPGRPDVYQAYPKMLYMARQTPSGKWQTHLEAPAQFGFHDMNEWDRACQAAAKFTESCQRTVQDESEHKRAREEGWRDHPTEAMEFRNALESAVGKAAAERNWQDRRMSEKAKAESTAAEAEHFGHLGEIPAKPVDRMAKARAAKAAKKTAA